jgi:predicted NUDIX family NTP pyrophosphohydrolase
MKKISAGILVYRKNKEEKIEVLLAHNGGPYFQNKDAGFWNIPKGLIDENEDLLEAAKREFKEETGFDIGGNLIPLGEIERKDGKTIHAWAVENSIDTSKAKSNTVKIEWPPKTGKVLEFPEIDKIEYFPIEAAREKIHHESEIFIDRLLEKI